MISPEVVKSLFEFTNKNYSLRNASILKKLFHSGLWKRNSCIFSSENMGTCSRFNQRDNYQFSKLKLQAWTTDKCPCRLCKNYIGQVGFI